MVFNSLIACELRAFEQKAAVNDSGYSQNRTHAMVGGMA
jgi:hypothetical protein